MTEKKIEKSPFGKNAGAVTKIPVQKSGVFRGKQCCANCENGRTNHVQNIG